MVEAATKERVVGGSDESREKQPLLNTHVEQPGRDAESGTPSKRARFCGFGMTAVIITYYAACSSTMVGNWWLPVHACLQLAHTSVYVPCSRSVHTCMPHASDLHPLL